MAEDPAAEPNDVAPATAPDAVPGVSEAQSSPAAPKLQRKIQPGKPASKPAIKKPAVAKARPATSSARIVAATATKEPMMDTTDQAKSMFADLGDRARGTVEKTTKAFEELNAFGKGNIEAIVESSKIAARGIETLGQDAAAYAKTSLEGTTEAIKTLAATRSPSDFLKLQGDFMRQSFDAMIAHSSRSTEALLKLAGEVAQPISNRVALATEKLKVAA